MHYYKFNIADWNLATAHLSLTEEAIYFRLINFYYDTEQPIPLETRSVFRRLRMANESDTAQLILDEFFTKTDRGYIHSRCDDLLKEYRKTLKNNRLNGAKGGRPRKDAAYSETQTKPSGLFSETQTEPTHNPNQEPITNNQKPKENKKPPAPKNKFSDDDYKCAEWLSAKLKEFIPDCRTPNLSGWAKNVRDMRELDNRTHKEICDIWLWCRNDSFESANVQSPDKLRRRYDQLKLKMTRPLVSTIPSRTLSTTRDRSLMEDLTDKSWAN